VSDPTVERVDWALAVGKESAPAGLLLIKALDALGVSARQLEGSSARSLSTAITNHTKTGGGVVAVGGDGTVNLVADALLAAGGPVPPSMAMLPAGTGSDFARLFGFSGSAVEAARRIVDGESYPLDVGTIEGPFGTRRVVNVAETGLGASALELAERLPRQLGSIKYQLAFPLVLPSFKTAHISLQTDTRTWEGEATLVVFANAEYFGGGLKIAPRASVVDGKFNVLIMEGGKWGSLRLFQKMKTGLHLQDPRIHHFVTRAFRLETSIAWDVETDGEYLGTGPVEGRIEPSALILRV
jgi:diacylglycerol kinase (ATP)